jgi:PPK2 family polyphosphate:nucleotide phosphotransferase
VAFTETHQEDFTTMKIDPSNLKEFVKRFAVAPGSKIDLKKDFDPGDTAGYEKPENASAFLDEGVAFLADYQEKLYAENARSLLVVLQALDAAGKDSTIDHVMSGVNPQGCQVYSFKAPTPEELDHDFLWRAVKALPARGNIGIFNRSHYEEVLVVRVHPQFLTGQRLPPRTLGEGLWKQRFEEINNFEKYLVDNGTDIVKIYLNVSKDEQCRRQMARIDTQVLGRLPGRVRGCLRAHQHALGAMVRRAGRPKVVRAHRGSGHHRPQADRDGSAVSYG